MSEEEKLDLESKLPLLENLDIYNNVETQAEERNDTFDEDDDGDELNVSRGRYSYFKYDQF